MKANLTTKGLSLRNLGILALISILFFPCLSASAQKEVMTVVLSPNPVSTTLTVAISDTFNTEIPVRVQVFNVLGQEETNFTASFSASKPELLQGDNVITIDVQNLGNAYHFLVITNELMSLKLTKRFLKD